MKQDELSHDTPSLTGWQKLGELELPVGSSAVERINAWLSHILIPLHLHVDFLNKVLQSAQDVAARLKQTEMVIKYQHTCLLLYIPENRPLNVQTWGFFRIEKVETAAENENSCDRLIEFYLFLEGQ
jgi:hypothetical protein